jgi:cytochrome c-type biogenesis protein CcmE
MRTKTLIGTVLLLGFMSLLFLNFGEQVGGYMNFAEAEQSSASAHVVGTWVEEKPASYDRRRNVFTFYMKDKQGAVREVRYPNPKPANFAEADKLVVKGQPGKRYFEAKHILVKCPSKYNKADDIKAQKTASS